MAKINKTFAVHLVSDDDSRCQEITFETFDKDKITQALEDLLRETLPGEWVEYGWSDQKRVYGAQLVIENRDGVYKRMVTRGNWTGYFLYEMKTTPRESIAITGAVINQTTI